MRPVRGGRVPARCAGALGSAASCLVLRIHLRAAALPAAGQFDHRLRDLHARPGRAGSRPGIPGAERFKGYAADEIIGQHFSVFFTPEDREAGFPQARLQHGRGRGAVRSGGLARPQGRHAASGPMPSSIRSSIRRAATSASPRSPATSPPSASRRKRPVRERAALPDARPGRARLRHLHARHRGPRHQLERRRAEHQGLFGRRDRRPAFLPLLHGGGPRPRRAPVRARDRASRRQIRTRGLARPQGRYARSGRASSSIRSSTRAASTSASPRSPATSPSGRRPQEQLEEARTALVQSQKLQALGELTGGIAHDFNNLMTVIAGSADFLLRKPDLPEEKRRQYLEAIVETADRATTLTNHLLAFGRRQPIKPEVLDLNVRLDALGGVLSRTLGSSDRGRARSSAPASCRVEVDVRPARNRDAQRRGQCPRRHAGRRHADPLDARRSARMARSSSHLPSATPARACRQEVIERAFEPFFTTKEVGKGTGLGLSQIHGFAAQAGGRAEIASEEGARNDHHASCFPATGQGARSPRSSGETMPDLPEGLRVLLVEDNPQVREFAEGPAGRPRLRGRVARKPAEQALELLETKAVDLVLSDVVMPGMSGVELARQIAGFASRRAGAAGDRLQRRDREAGLRVRRAGQAVRRRRPQQGHGGCF